jgi:hypothetical protein
MLFDCAWPRPFDPRSNLSQISPFLCTLAPTDRSEYIKLFKFFASLEDRNRRNQGLTTFIKHLGMIHAFVCRGDPSDGLRGIACGVEFGIGAFMTNTNQLKLLMHRSKSCVNGCFQKMGYTVCRPAQDMAAIFARILPRDVRADVVAIRQWCVRRADEASQISFIPNVHGHIAAEERTKNDPVALFDIRKLLNRTGGDAEIHRIPCAPLPSLAAFLN